MQFGYAMTPHLMSKVVAGTGSTDYLELNRMWLDDAAPRNSESRALSYAIKYIRRACPRVRWIQSFADERCGGLGVVYQAAGFEGYIREEIRPWIAAWWLDYEVKIDGISLVMVLLTTFLGPIVVLGAWSAVEQRHKEFWFHILLLQAAMIGTFVALRIIRFASLDGSRRVR